MLGITIRCNKCHRIIAEVEDIKELENVESETCKKLNKDLNKVTAGVFGGYTQVSTLEHFALISRIPICCSLSCEDETLLANLKEKLHEVTSKWKKK
ncbi:UNVERIFIED_ORG: hypothetical protein EDC93_1011147 [Bacillus cereus]